MVKAQHHLTAEAIHARLGHPVIDADGHYVELLPVLQRYTLEYLRKAGGADMVKRLMDAGGPLNGHAEGALRWSQIPKEEVRDSWLTVTPFGAPNLSALDRATSYLPALLSERMDGLGIDYAVLYPTMALAIGGRYTHVDRELRQAVFRAFNCFLADYFRGEEARMTPAAVVPMESPQEAIEELEYAVKVLKLKTAMCSIVSRPIPRIAREHPDLARQGARLDTFGIDSDYNYDLFWAKCVELGVAPAFHSGVQGGSRRSISLPMYNQAGNFAAGGEAVCKSLFYGGVTRRFPSLRVAFLEGGVAWGCNLYAEMLGHWKKRNQRAWKEVDFGELMQLVDRYGSPMVQSQANEIKWSLAHRMECQGQDMAKPVDDWQHVRIERAEDFYDLFVPNFFFGCEADDPMNSLAFNTRINPFGAKLGAVLSSDLGHWDLPDMDQMLPEAYELVEKGVLTDQGFKDFSFTNAVRLWGEMDPNFFKGTRVEAEANQVLREIRR